MQHECDGGVAQQERALGSHPEDARSSRAAPIKTILADFSAGGQDEQAVASVNLFTC